MPVKQQALRQARFCLRLLFPADMPAGCVPACPRPLANRWRIPIKQQACPPIIVSAMTATALPYNDRLTLLSPAAGTTSLDGDFELAREDGLAVIRIRAGVRTPLANGIDYTFPTGPGGPSGFRIDLVTATLVDDDYVLAGLEPIERLSDFEGTTRFNAAQIDADLDQLIRHHQEARRDIDRAVKAPMGSAGVEFAAVAEGHIWKADASGNMVDGGSAADIADAQENAAIATAERIAAEAAAAQAALDAAAVTSIADVSRDDLTGPTLAMPAINVRNRVHDVFSVMETFDTSAQREEIRNRTAVFDASPYINAAIDYAYRRDYRTVKLPFGQYVLAAGATRLGSNGCLILLKPNVCLEGDGLSTVIKVADGMTTASDYKIMSQDGAASLGNLSIEKIRFDCNGLNNLVPVASDRRAIPILIRQADYVRIDQIRTDNNPGRQCVVLAEGFAATPSVKRGEITRCVFANNGKGVPGNTLQDDHSSIYTQFDEGGLVAWNRIWNDVAVDGDVTAFETHGSNTDVCNNHAHKMGPGANIAATVVSSYNNRFFQNKWTGTTINGLLLWTLGYKQRGLVIKNNHIEIDNDNFSGSAIYQFPTAGTTDYLEIPDIADNYIRYTKTPAAADISNGIELTAAKNARIRGNTIENCPGTGILLFNAPAMDIDGVEIKNNTLIDCGSNSLVTAPYAIRVENDAASGGAFSKIRIERNHIKRTLRASGVAPHTARGIQIKGGGYLDVTLQDNSFENISLGQRNVIDGSVVAPSVVRAVPAIRSSGPKAAEPNFGHWEIGDKMLHTDTTATGDYEGRIAISAGAGSATTAVWAATTAYAKGAFVRLSTNKVLQCTKAGTSGGAEPVPPATLNQVLTDGTAEWVYTAAIYAAFRRYGVNAV